MSEQKIIIEIDENGAIEATTEGFHGESCVEALEKIFDKNIAIKEMTKTDDADKVQTQKQKQQIKQR